MDDAVDCGEGAKKQTRARKRGANATPIWRSRLYRERRQQTGAARIDRPRARRYDDATLLCEKRDLADRLFDLCETAHNEVSRRGGDTAAALHLIAELSFIVSCWDAEAGESGGPPRERLQDSRDLLGAMLLASEVTRLAMTRAGARSSPALDPKG